MRTLFINPPVPDSFSNKEFYMPSGLMYLGAVLKKHSDEVKLIDLKTLRNESRYDSKILESISDFKPDIIGFGGLISANFLDILRYSKMCKEKFPKIPILMGGAHASMYPYEILKNCSSIDWLALGEAEETVINLTERINGDSDFTDIDGFAFRKDGEVKINPKKKFIDDLDTLPFPAYSLIDMKDYDEDTSRWHNPKGLEIRTEVPIISSRSCPYNCNFCSSKEIMGRGWRARSPENVVDEIEYLYREHRQTHFGFMDDNLTLDKKRILKICDEINRRNLNIQFETHNGVSIRTLDKEVIDAMASAGLTRIALPIESGSDYIRNGIMNKKLSREKIFEVIEYLKNFKQIFTRAFFIIGMPEETQETLRDSYDMIKQIRVDKVHLTNIIPFPGSGVFKQALKDNLLVNVKPSDLYLSDKLYQTNYDTFFIKPYELEIEELQRFRGECTELIKKINAPKE